MREGAQGGSGKRGSAGAEGSDGLRWAGLEAGRGQGQGQQGPAKLEGWGDWSSMRKQIERRDGRTRRSSSFLSSFPFPHPAALLLAALVRRATVPGGRPARVGQPRSVIISRVKTLLSILPCSLSPRHHRPPSISRSDLVSLFLSSGGGALPSLGESSEREKTTSRRALMGQHPITASASRDAHGRRKPNEHTPVLVILRRPSSTEAEALVCGRMGDRITQQRRGLLISSSTARVSPHTRMSHQAGQPTMMIKQIYM